MKIAILQNKIGIDGRSAVVAETMRVCNAQGYTPTLFSFSQQSDVVRFLGNYGQGLNFRTYFLRFAPIKRGTAYQTPLLNISASSHLKMYDLVINSGRCPYFLTRGPVYIHYVHFPVEASLKEEEHFQGYRGRIYILPLKMLYWGRFRKRLKGFFVANSLYTMKKIRELYKMVPENRFRVIYPPCRLPEKVSENRKDLDVATLGSFISDKRQMEQLEIARLLPRVSFFIMGGIKSHKYYNKCNKYVKRFKLNNVKLIPNASWDFVADVLGRAKVFLHTRRGEHFGISTVEALGYGCVPVVHDSAGARETVPLDELRFQSTSEAVIKVQTVLDGYSAAGTRYSRLLRKNAQKFSTTEFRRQMAELIFGNA